MLTNDSHLSQLLEEFKEITNTERDKGTLFERLIKKFLQTDPQYSNLFENVWLWSEWKYSWGQDDGIDLVAKERNTGNYWAIQCKFFDPKYTIQKSDIDSFLSASGKKFVTNDGEEQFSYRLIVSTTNHWGKLVEKAISNQTIPVLRLGLKDLEESPIDWSSFTLSNIEKLKVKTKKSLRKHQEEAIKATIEGFKEANRGKLIMACGTGKTFTSLALMEQYVPKDGKVLFLAPSISLVSQTLREWTAQANEPFNAYVVCSDSKVGRDEEDITTSDLAYPATTDPNKLAKAISKANKDKRVVIFSTYQSIQTVSDAQKEGFGEFDLVICDEAHRTAGVTLSDSEYSNFVKIHHDHIIRAKKRLYMTATPRIYAEASKTKADENNATLFSMDDETVYGKEFYRLGFGKAVELGLLTEYKVLIVAVDEDKMAHLANDFNAFKVDNKKAIDIKFATKIIGAWKGLSKQGLKLIGDKGEQEDIKEDTNPMKRAVAFSRSIKESKQKTEIFEELINLYLQNHPEDKTLVDCELKHIDGSMNALIRQEMLDWLKEDIPENRCRILSNARCLSEGIDVPTLDAVIFFDTRESIVDIVQSVGRVMRKADGKMYGYIILPVVIPSKKIKDYNSYIESDPQFKGIWKVIKALRAHDESLVDEATFRTKIQVVSDTEKSDSSSTGENTEQTVIEFPTIPVEEISEAVYAAIPKKLGDREYWSEWAKSVAVIAERLISRIKSMIDEYPEANKAFQNFLNGLKENINPAVTKDEAIEMLSQHTITKPVFDALFEGNSFTKQNPVSKAMQSVMEELEKLGMHGETEELEKFYENIKERISYAKSDKSRQEIIKNLYDTFFKNAFPKMSERLGIVYTPIEVVDFIVKSADFALKKHFNTSLTDKNVKVLDPFTGTGTFIARLIQSGLIKKEDLPYKYENELFANEIVLLAYYIAAINIENAYHSQVGGEYKPFEGIVLTDTFQMTENQKSKKQLEQDIRVIIGNPPYSAKQKSQNDNNQNISYPKLDERIEGTYVAKSKATLKRSLYDSYIRSIRWATDRIKDKGIIAFVTNGSFIEANSMDGLRKSLVDEFSYLYVFNLRGNARTQGDERRREGGGVFGEGSRTPVAITIMVKDPEHKGECELYYYDIGDYKSREEKLKTIEELESIKNISSWQTIRPNEDGDWINQGDPIFKTFMEIGTKEKGEKSTIFSIYSLGIATNRDAWVYSFSKDRVSENMQRMIENYNKNVEKYKNACKGLQKNEFPRVEDIIDTNPKNISWTANLKQDVRRFKTAIFKIDKIVQSMYRPFTKEWLYFDKQFIERTLQIPKLFPTTHHKNIVISATGIGASKPFSALVTDFTPDLELISKGQCFPLYWYKKVEENNNAQSSMDFNTTETPDEFGYIRREAITDWALQEFRTHYEDDSIDKEDIFWYIYGIFHSLEYKTRFSADLKKMLPRIPFVSNFWGFSKAGKELGELHLNYEDIEPYPLTINKKKLVMDKDDYRVKKMIFGKSGKEKDKTTIIYNENITIKDIPLEAYNYVVNGKSAIEWIMERYQIKVDKASKIENNPNDWSDNPEYILDLLCKIVKVSMESIKIIERLPKLDV